MLKLSLKWVFFLFCGIVTLQFLFGIVTAFAWSSNPINSMIVTFHYYTRHIYIALATSLPAFILTGSKRIAQIPLSTRTVAHFLLTFSILYFLFFSDYVFFFDNLLNYRGNRLLLFLLFLSFGFYFLATFFYGKSIQTMEQKQKKQIEQRYLKNFVAEVESQHIAINQFKHDYQNILFSLKIHLEQGDFLALKEYFRTKILPFSWNFISDDFVFQDSKIKKPTEETFFLNLRNILSQIYLFFCVAITLQLLIVLVGTIVTRWGYLDNVTFPFWNTINILIVAFGCSVPILILADTKVTSRIPLIVRHFLHLILMAVTIFILLFFLNGLRLTTPPPASSLIASSEEHPTCYIEEGQFDTNANLDYPESQARCFTSGNVARIYSVTDLDNALADATIDILYLENDISIPNTIPIREVNRNLTINGNGHSIIALETHSYIDSLPSSPAALFQLGAVAPRNITINEQGIETHNLPGATLILIQVNFHSHTSDNAGTAIDYFFYGTKEDTVNWDVVIVDYVTTGAFPVTNDDSSFLNNVQDNPTGLLHAAGARVVIMGEGNIVRATYSIDYRSNQHHQFFIHRLELRPMASLKVVSAGNAATSLRIEGEHSRILLAEGAILTVNNSGHRTLHTHDQNTDFSEEMSRTTERGGSPSGSNAIYGAISKLEMRAGASLNLTATNIGFRSVTTLHMSMVDGARLNIDGDNKRGAFIVAGGSEHAYWDDTVNTQIYLSGSDTKMTLASENWLGGHQRGENFGSIHLPDYAGNPGSGGYTGTMRIIGNNSTITLTNGATLSIGEPDTIGGTPTSRGTALLVMGEAFTLNVESQARLLAQSRQTQIFVRTGATLPVRQGGTIHFYGLPNEGYRINVIGGYIRAINFGAGPAMRVSGGGSRLFVCAGGHLILESVAKAFPLLGAPLAPDFNTQSTALQYAHSQGKKEQLYITGTNSKVSLYSAGGSAIRGSTVELGSIVKIYVGEDATFVAKGKDSQGTIYGYDIDFQINSPYLVSIYNNAYNSDTLIYSTAEQWRWLLLTIPIFSFIFFLLTTLIMRRNIRIKITTKKEQMEWDIFQEYAHKMQLHHNAMNAFKGECRNILFTLDEYLERDDLPGLRDYYFREIAPTSEKIGKHTSIFEHLDKIKVPEIKSIFIVKLMLAQHLNIHTSFFANEDINYIPIDSIALVRMLGIVLDNAIEALETQSTKKLEICCFNTERGVYFVIGNTCPKDLPPLHILWEKNFTTKGGSRGLGLTNLVEIVAQIPNATLETDIVGENFVQKITLANSIERG